MKSLIIYYTQTGNTGKIARSIHKGLGQVVEQCDILPLKKAKYTDLDNYDLIGIGSPIWFADTPNLTYWLDGVPAQKGKLAFFFCTHGTIPLLYAPIMSRRLAMKEFRVVGWNDWYGGNPVPGTPANYTDGHPDEIDLKEAEDFGRKMGENSKRIIAGETSLFPPLPPMPVVSFQVVDLLLRGIHKMPGFALHGIYSRDETKCRFPNCTMCIDYCPMNYIDLSAEPQRFGSEGDRCNTGCSYCEMICPAGAISQIGGWMNSNRQSEAKRLGAIAKLEGKNAFVAAIEDAEAQGRFRRLIPREQVGKILHPVEGPVKHPRFNIPKEEQ